MAQTHPFCLCGRAEFRDPQFQSAVAIANYSLGIKRRTDCELKSLGSAFNESMDSALPADQQYAVGVFIKSPDAIKLAWKRKEFWWSRFPSPQPIHDSCPEIALAVLVQVKNCATKSAIISETLNAAVSNRTQLSRRHCRGANPHRSFTVLEEDRKSTRLNSSHGYISY